MGLRGPEINITVANVQFPEEQPQIEEECELEQQQAREQEQQA